MRRNEWFFKLRMIVLQALPPYFKYEIKFAPAMKTRLVGRVLEYLDQAAR